MENPTYVGRKGAIMAKTGTVTKTSKKALKAGQYRYDNDTQLLTLCVKATIDEEKGRILFAESGLVRIKGKNKKGEDTNYPLQKWFDEFGNCVSVMKAGFDFAKNVNSVSSENEALKRENEALNTKLTEMENKLALFMEKMEENGLL